MTENQKIRKGKKGEWIAALELLDLGYEVFYGMCANESCDLIAHKFGRLMRIQVKTNPESEITPDKQEVVAWVNVETRTVVFEPPLEYSGVNPDGPEQELTIDIGRTIVAAVRDGKSPGAAARYGGVRTGVLEKWLRWGVEGKMPYAEFAMAFEKYAENPHRGRS